VIETTSRGAKSLVIFHPPFDKPGRRLGSLIFAKGEGFPLVFKPLVIFNLR